MFPKWTIFTLDLHNISDKQKLEKTKMGPKWTVWDALLLWTWIVKHIFWPIELWINHKTEWKTSICDWLVIPHHHHIICICRSNFYFGFFLGSRKEWNQKSINYQVVLSILLLYFPIILPSWNSFFFTYWGQPKLSHIQYGRSKFKSTFHYYYDSWCHQARQKREKNNKIQIEPYDDGAECRRWLQNDSTWLYNGKTETKKNHAKFSSSLLCF